jgi:hypothetical protein
VSSIQRLLPLLDEAAEDFDAGIGKYRRRAYLKGTIQIDNGTSLQNSADDELIEVEFRLIGEIGLVITNVPLVKYDSAQKIETATVYLVCSYHVQDETTYGYVHHSVTRGIAPAGGGTKALRLPHVEKRIIAEYSGTAVSGINTNEGTVNGILNGALDAAQSQYQIVQGSVVKYQGIQPHPLSGTCRQIRILVDRYEGCFTWLAWNTEWAPGMPRRHHRRRIAAADRDEALRELEDKTRRQLIRKGVV